MRVRAAVALLALTTASAALAVTPEPIIDMHLHAQGAGDYGPPGQTLCAPYPEWPPRDPARPIDEYFGRLFVKPSCAHKITAPTRDDEIRDRSIAILKRRNIRAVTSGDAGKVDDWYKHAPDHIIPALHLGDGNLPTIAELRSLHSSGRLKVIGELTFQYAGIAPNDPRIEPYYALAEELDVPIAIHVGPGPPGVTYFGAPGYRMALSNALLLEDVLVRHPRLRLYVMHAGWPLGDQMIALMYAHPQVYVDTGIIDWAYPRPDFHAYLKRLVDAGFEKRIMFGSDQMIWPEAIDAAIDGLTSAKFLTPQQKRDILYNNAARFLRLTPKPGGATRGS